MKKVATKNFLVVVLLSLFLGLSTYATQIPIPSSPADSLEHFLENHTDMYANGDTILIVDSFYVVSGTADLYHGVTIMGDPARTSVPIIQFLDNGFRLKQDSTSVYIKGLYLNGFNDDKTHRAKFILRMDNIPASDSIFYNMVIEDVEAVGFGGGIDLHQQKHAEYDSITVNNVIWHDFSGEYCVDPNINFPGVLTVTNSTFYNITHGFVKNPDFASDKNNYTKIPKKYIIDHNTFYKVGGYNNALVQVNDPKDSTVTFTFTNNIVEKLYDPTNVRPFRINESAGTFDFNTNVIYDYMPTNPDKMQYSFDSTVANQTNVTETNTITDDPKLLDEGDFRLPKNSPLLTADTEGGQIGDPRWGIFEGVYIYEPKVDIYTNNVIQLEAAIVLESGDTVLNWTIENRYDGTRGEAEIVDSTGLLTTTVPGTVKITATSEEDGAFFDTLIISFSDSVHVEAVTLKSNGDPIINEKEGDLDIIASLTPSNPTYPKVDFSISDESLAKFYVRSDTTIELVAVANGVVSVYAVSVDGEFKDTLDITITNQVSVEGVELSVAGGGDPVIQAIGDSIQLIATIIPDTADIKLVSWKAEPSELATVDDGWVKALQSGTVSIIVETADGGYTDTLDVTIQDTKPVESVAISVQGGGEAQITSIGGTLQLEAAITPADADNKNVTWTADPTSVATVDNNGLVTAVAEGTVKITVTTVDGGKTDDLDVVVDVPESVNSSIIEKLAIMPNPAVDFIKFNNQQEVVIAIHNITGELVINQIVEVGGSVDIQELSNGMYIVNISIEDQVKTIQFVKE